MAYNTDEMREYMQARRTRIKQEMRDLLGDHCIVCGSTEDLEFDHVDPATKLFQISGRGLDKNRDLLLTEVHKCQLLCAKHHREKSRTDGSLKGRPTGPIRHGTAYAYDRRGCRCEECRETKRRRRRTEAGASSGL